MAHDPLIHWLVALAAASAVACTRPAVSADTVSTHGSPG
jgi:hypothetical protein